MLEHEPMPTPPVDPGMPSESIATPDFYTPPGRAEPLTGRGKAPSVKRFNRKMLAAIAIIAGTVVILAFSVGLRVPKKQPAPAQDTASHTPLPNESVNSLPSSYAEVVPALGEPRPGDLGRISNSSGAGPVAGAPRQLSPIEQYTQQLELDRLHREDSARGAGVAFANSSAAGAASSAAQTSPNLQEKILELAQRSGAGGSNTVPTAYKDGTDGGDQEGKNSFVDRARSRDFELHAHLESPRSPFTLFAGTILPCVMTQGINSDLPGQIGCMISQNVYDTVTGSHLLLPQGTKAIGTYDSRVAYGQNRVLVVWTRLMRPDGSTLSLEGMPGTDLSGYAGLSGHVNNHYLRLLGGVVMGSLIGASAQIATGANSQNPGFAALAAQGAGQNINEAGQLITRKNLNIQPTIEVRPGSRLNIFATKDLVLPPWTDL